MFKKAAAGLSERRLFGLWRDAERPGPRPAGPQGQPVARGGPKVARIAQPTDVGTGA